MDGQLNGEFILTGNKSEDDPPKESSVQQNATPIGISPHFYSSYCQNPEGLTFAEQEQNEKILLLLRRHFVTNVPWIVSAILLSILPFSFPFFIRNSPFVLPSTHTLILALVFYYLVLFGFTLLNFTLWYFNAGLVTNTRVVDVDLSGILYRQIAETKVENIEDVTYKQVGFIRSLFNYGTVLVQTAGAEENIEYDRVPRPSKVSEIIGDLSQKA